MNADGSLQICQVMHGHQACGAVARRAVGNTHMPAAIYTHRTMAQQQAPPHACDTHTHMRTQVYRHEGDEMLPVVPSPRTPIAYRCAFSHTNSRTRLSKSCGTHACRNERRASIASRLAARLRVRGPPTHRRLAHTRSPPPPPNPCNTPHPLTPLAHAPRRTCSTCQQCVSSPRRRLRTSVPS